MIYEFLCRKGGVMFFVVVPIFMVILLGYYFGKIKPDDGGSDKLINDYVLYVALPALLFLAVAQSDLADLQQWDFLWSTLFGIVSVYVIGGVVARLAGIELPGSSILSMGASYGTTGYMGVPILLSVYGSQAALPAAIATIIHNIPAIMAVIISWDVFGKKAGGEGVFPVQSALRALRVTLTNPLTVSVLAGLAFVVFGVNVPGFLDSFASFLGAAAGPTALFALGLGLSRLDVKEHVNSKAIKVVVPMVVLKTAVQPIITFLVAVYFFGMGDGDELWLAAAVVMAAQPIGAGVYVFAKKYGYKPDTISLAIIVSLLVSLVTIPVVLGLFGF
ncbi:AEC family transporter [Halomonas elongata]|uniref:AEC family transporter n=1 Tax=Halomonas elongata TaxID=2746 RepID=UPI0033646CA2